MKRILINMSLAALALTGCTQTELIDTNAVEKGMIDYALYTGRPTRATELNNTNFEQFKIYAYQNIENGATFDFSAYYNETVKKGSSTWAGPRPRRWPEKTNDYLNFYAYSDEDNAGNYIPATSTTNHPKFDYTVPQDATKQQDLLVAAAFNQTERTNQSKLNLNFKHALTQVAFKVKSASPNFEVKVSKVELIGVNSGGTFTYDGTATVGGWSNPGTTEDYAFDVETPGKVGNTDFVALSAAEGNLMMIPNDNPKDVKIRVTYTLNDDTDVLVKEIKLETESTTAGANQPAIVPVTPWTMGKRITYNLTLPGKANEIIFGDATMNEDWDATEDETAMEAKEIFGVSFINVSGMQKKNQSGFLLEINDNRQTAGTFSLTSDQSWVKFSETENDYNNAEATLTDVQPVTRATTATKKVYVYTDNNMTGVERIATITMTRADYSTVEIEVRQVAADLKEVDFTGANSYIITSAGTYAFDATIKGNGKQVKLPANYDATTNPATDIPENAADVNIKGATKAEVLWETVNTASAPKTGTIVKDVVLSDDGKMVFFTTTATEGNAVIVVKDATNKVLWSWHIWRTNTTLEAMTKELATITSTEGTFDINGESTLSGIKIMDRNLGALSAVPQDALSAGLIYQWGRPVPFPGASNISSGSLVMELAGTVVDTAESNSSIPLATAEANPQTYYKKGTTEDWTSRNDNLWGTPSSDSFIKINNNSYFKNHGHKTIYDPCPKGWRLPPHYIFGNATLATKDNFNLGYNFSILISSETLWFPASGNYSPERGTLGYIGTNGNYWSSSPRNANFSRGSDMNFTNTSVNPASNFGSRSTGCAVKCIQE